MTKTTITPDRDAVVGEIQIAAPPERVFKALTDRAQAMQWGSNELFETFVWEMDARAGGKWQFISRERTGPNAGRQYEHHGEILEMDPPRLLVYSWFANWHEPATRQTVVRWEITASGEGSKVKMTHSGLKQIKGACEGYSQGWPGLLEELKKYLEQ